MKNIVLMLTAMFCIPSLALAQEVEAGMTPDHPLHFGDRLMENIQLALQFNAENREMFRLQIAEERLAEAEAMIELNKTELAETSMNRYETRLRQLNQTIESGQHREEVRNRIMERLKTHVETQQQKLSEIKENIAAKKGQ